MTHDEMIEARQNIALLAQIMHEKSRDHDKAGRERAAEEYAGYEADCWKAASAIVSALELSPAPTPES